MNHASKNCCIYSSISSQLGSQIDRTANKKKYLKKDVAKSYSKIIHSICQVSKLTTIVKRLGINPSYAKN